MKKNVTLTLFCTLILCLLVSCQKFHDEKNLDSSQDRLTNDTSHYDKNIESKAKSDSDVEELLKMTYNEIKKSGVAMSLSYYEGGGSPVYKIDEHEGLYLVFPPIEADISGNVSDEFLNDNFPKKLLIQSKDIYVYPGISVGMSAEEVKLFHIEWEDIYMSSENSLYYTSFQNGTQRITSAWAIPEKTFSAWAAGLSDEDDYYAKFLEFIQPFKTEPIGTIVELTVEEME